MTKAKTARLMGALLAAAVLAACSNQGGFESLGNPGNNSQGSTGGDNSGQGTDVPPPVPKPPSAYDKLELSAHVGGGAYENEQVMSLDKANNALASGLVNKEGISCLRNLIVLFYRMLKGHKSKGLKRSKNDTSLF